MPEQLLFPSCVKYLDSPQWKDEYSKTEPGSPDRKKIAKSTIGKIFQLLKEDCKNLNLVGTWGKLINVFFRRSFPYTSELQNALNSNVSAFEKFICDNNNVTHLMEELQSHYQKISQEDVEVFLHLASLANDMNS